MKLIIFTDGASRGNPGEAGIGIHVTNSVGDSLMEISEYLGKTTNNVAEYKALIRGLEEARKYSPQEIQVFSDSELIVKQITGIYRVKNEGLLPLYKRVVEMLQEFPQWKVDHIPREKNKIADKLANKGIDGNKR